MKYFYFSYIKTYPMIEDNSPYVKVLCCESYKWDKERSCLATRKVQNKHTIFTKKHLSARIWLTTWMITAVFILSNSTTPLYVFWQQELNFSNSTLTLIFASYIAGPVVDVGGSNLKQTASLAASVSMVLGAGLGPLLSSILTNILLKPVVPIFMIQIGFLICACLVVWTLPERNIDQHNQKKWDLHWPSVPPANRLHLAVGIAAFAPGITATSFVLSLGPSLLTKLLHVTNPVVGGATACVMFLIAAGIQLVLNKFPVRVIFIVSMVATFLFMTGIITAFAVSSAVPFIIAAIMAGMGQGLGQLGGLMLISLHVPEHRRAEGNAILNMGGYIPAALYPICTGLLMDRKGLIIGAVGFAIVLTVQVICAFFFIYAKLRSNSRIL